MTAETRGGVEGAWVPGGILKQFLLERADLDECRERSALLDRQLEIRDGRVLALQGAADESAEVAANVEASLVAAVRAQREAEDELGAWYRSPWFLVGAGVVVTVGLELTLAAALGAL